MIKEMRLFFNKQQIAEALSLTAGVAASVLSEKGLEPVDFGRGRGRGLRWYAPAVEGIVRELHEEAQRKNESLQQKKTRIPKSGLVTGRSVNDLFSELTGEEALQ